VAKIVAEREAVLASDGSEPADRRDHDERSWARALALTAASVPVPGLGHLRAGRRRTGVASLAFFALILLAAGIAAATVSQQELVRYSVQPRFLTLVMTVAAVLAAWWLAVVVTSYRVLRPAHLGTGRRIAGAAFVAVLCLVVLAPPVVATRYAYAQRSLVTSVFPDTDTRVPHAAGGAVRTDPWADKGRVNVLLLGGDGGYNRYGIRTDSMTLASIDTTTGRTVLLSLPRNLQRAPMPAGPMRERFPNGFDDLLNEVYQYPADHREVAPPGATNPGADLLKETVSGILGLPVDYFVLVNLEGFKDIVDALGGVTVRVTEPIRYGRQGHVLEPGVHRLTGSQALWYGRSRTDSDDYTRMRRQRCLMGAIARQADPVTVLRRFRELTSATKRVLLTDIPRGRLPDFVDLAARAKNAEVSSVQFVPPLIKTYRPDWDLIRVTAAEAIAASEADADDRQTGTASPSPGAGGSPTPSPTGSPTGSPTASPGATAPPAAGSTPSTSPAPVSLDQVCQYD
jgi:LCP family protein required for cell wall assembly